MSEHPSPGRRPWPVWVAAGVYLYALARLTVLKSPRFLVEGSGWEPAPWALRLRFAFNGVPFRTILGYLAGEPTPAIALHNLAGNVLLFVPWGFLWAYLFPGRARSRDVLGSAFTASFLIEALQFALGVGQWDVDDLILNVLGAALGLLAYRGWQRVIRDRAESPTGLRGRFGPW